MRHPLSHGKGSRDSSPSRGRRELGAGRQELGAGRQEGGNGATRTVGEVPHEAAVRKKCFRRGNSV